MCGIAGYFGRFERAVAEAMTARIAHRGPDGDGFWFDDEAGVGLGHRRLAIIDLSEAAAQPMPGVNGRYQVSFNGEIYNFRDHVARLQADGYHFNPNSDTAILAPLYDKLGPRMLEELNGIFAFALWDGVARRLFVARDHYGIKPLYYAQTPHGLVFASELKAMVAVPEIDRSIDMEAISNYLLYQWCPGRLTPLRGVRKLPPGHYLEIDSGGLREVRWHTPPLGRVREFDRRPAAELRAELQGLLDDVVAQQSIADVDIGLFLSGGVDSSAVAASLARRKIPVARTYCISFRGASMEAEGFGNDVDFARDLAAQWKLPFTDLAVDEPSMAEFEDMAFQLDEPQGDIAPLLVRKISEQARADGIKVLMGGTGGDDVFTGYRRHRVAWFLDRFGALAAPAGAVAKGLAGMTGGTLRNRLGKFAAMVSGSPEDNLRHLFEFNRPEFVEAALGIAVLARSGWLDAGLAETSGAPMVERALAGEFLGFLPDHNLAYTDKAAMAEGVEVRVPLIDPRLVAFASRLPSGVKMPFGEPKGFFKQAMADRLPQTILRRKKTGFGAPVRHWLSGRLREPFMDVIRSTSFRARGLFDAAAVETLFRKCVEGRIDAAYLLLTIVLTELWCRRFVDGPASVAPLVARSVSVS